MFNDGDTFTRDGATFRVRFADDDMADPPWKREDGHGPVSDWRHADRTQDYPPKAAGERVLCIDVFTARYYDFAQACKIARRDGWGAPGDEGMTPRQKAAHAAEADFQRMRAWCNAEWGYIGVTVELLDDAGMETGETETLWGVESDQPEHIATVAHDLAGEIISRLQQQMKGPNQ